MTWSPSTPVTGAAQTGFTSPTYTLSADMAPDVNAKQNAVTALGGTQAGVTAHSAASPFTSTFVKPKVMKAPGRPNAAGVVTSYPRNVYKQITRKGVTAVTGQPDQIMLITTTFEVVAGSEALSAANIRAAVSEHIGTLSQQASGIGDTLVSGIV